MAPVGPSAAHAAAPGRHYGLDWLRIGAFSLLMLYHVGMAFVTGSWVVKLAEIEWLSYPMMFLSPWRLATLFIIGGYAGRALLTRLTGPDRFAAERTKRLILPLLFAMALIIPPQSWVRLRAWHGYPYDYLHYLAHDAFRFGRLDGVPLPGWEHLWFVFYLWLFTMLLAAGLVFIPPALKVRLTALFDGLGKGSRLLWLPLLYLVPARVAITFTTGETHGLFDDWLTDAIYLPCFLFGFGLAGTRSMWPAIGRVWKRALVLALASYALLDLVEELYPGRAVPPHAMMALDRAAMAGMLWGMALVMLRLADTGSIAITVGAGASARRSSPATSSIRRSSCSSPGGFCPCSSIRRLHSRSSWPRPCSAAGYSIGSAARLPGCDPGSGLAPRRRGAAGPARRSASASPARPSASASRRASAARRRRSAPRRRRA